MRFYLFIKIKIIIRLYLLFIRKFIDLKFINLPKLSEYQLEIIYTILNHFFVYNIFYKF